MKMGLYKYLVMLIGLTNAPTSFQSLINHVLYDYINRIYTVYLNDILIYSKDPNKYTKHVMLILKKLQEYSLKVNLNKSEFD